MTFTALRKIKETVNRINEYNHVAKAQLKFTNMFLDGHWGTCIKYNVLHKEEIEEIITISNDLELLIFFANKGIHLQ